MPRSGSPACASMTEGDLFGSSYSFDMDSAKKGAKLMQQKYPGCKIFSMKNSFTRSESIGVSKFFRYVEIEHSWIEEWNSNGAWRIKVEEDEEEEFTRFLQSIIEY